ncbi:Gfo/Idh/MocA family protein [Paraburkholderia sp. RL17-337-BIB-A]|uniref:Gfo/Idh/MocA family protein n=1 Tax=Paraburkholderia sp. RL17-337-BIB-A TaxID=3031636 RepID=UPI0038B781BE
MLKFSAIGLDHRHIYHLIGGLLDAGAECAGYWTGTTDPRVVEGVQERFPSLNAFDDRTALLEDPSVSVIVCAAVPAKRAEFAVEAMRAGKDVVVDKPGVTSFAQLEEVKRVAAETGRIFSICFSERFVVPAVEVARRLVEEGAIGDVIQTMGTGPHRLNKGIRPSWFFEADQYGGILVDIASHQIDQFLVFTGSKDAEIVHSHVGHFGDSTSADFQDFGEVLLSSGARRGYIRVDWFTPDGLPTWGDGRLVILGTKGTIELRKYLDIEGRPGTDHLFISDQQGTRYIDCSREPLTYFKHILADVQDRTETAMRQEHVYTVSRLALEAQATADKRRQV